MYLAGKNLQFAPAAWPTAAALIVIACTLPLGNWQRSRADEKRMRLAEIEQRAKERAVVVSTGTRDEALSHRRARATGTFDASLQFYVDNRVARGQAGFHVVTPLRLEDGAVMLVNRGWIARDHAYPRAPRVPVPPGLQTVTGVLTIPGRGFVELSGDVIDGEVWQNLDIGRFRALRRVDVLPFVLAADAADPSLLPVEYRPEVSAEKHMEYMLTWYSLATLTGVLWFVFSFRQAGTDAKGSRP
ncbi:MAG TPA: SURF1 family protein [Usitatibacteraceae bacterium]|nr:SURF1 family protein [Usitatibacteraceae bacterium]